MNQIEHLIFDADDTLWENNRYYDTARENFITLCAAYGIQRKAAEQSFFKTEQKIVQDHGYGTANFLTILQVLADRFLPDSAYSGYTSLVNGFKEVIYQPRQALPGVEETLQQLKKKYQLHVLTKGDPPEQKMKLQQSGLNTYFTHSFIVCEKDEDTYRTILGEQNWISSRVCMIGNSPKSDINPALKCGMWAIFIPYAHTWYMESESLNKDHKKFMEIKKFHELTGILLNGNR